LDRAPVSIIHGHSSHHPKAIELYRNRLILHGCGDFLNDYEGITGHEQFRDDLALMYFADIDPGSADTVALTMAPLQIRRFQLVAASRADVDWLQRSLDRESRRFGARVEREPDGRLTLRRLDAGG
jgi:poly-gamma-glutamate synthesis protein (capsule biosynthesis protein)